MTKYVYASPNSDCFCVDIRPCEEYGNGCKEYVLCDPQELMKLEEEAAKADKLEREAEKLGIVAAIGGRAVALLKYHYKNRAIYGPGQGAILLSQLAEELGLAEDGKVIEGGDGEVEPGFYNIVELLREFLKHYPDDVFPRHADGKRDVGVIFVDMLKDVVDFLDEHPEGQAERQ